MTAMQRRVRPSHLALLTVLAAGCSPASLLDKIDAEFQEAGEIGCDCPGVDQAACQANFTSLFSFLDRACLEDALDLDRKASKETLKCFLDHMKGVNRCLEDNFQCSDAAASVMLCDPNPSDDCPPVPPEVNAAIQACGNDAE